MKNTFKIIGIIALAAIIGLSVLACDDPAPTPPAITTASLPGGMVAVAYNQTLAATGDTPITWSIDSGSLPEGLTLAAATGVISGTPTATGTLTFTVKATNDAGNDTKELSIAITLPPAPAITTASLPNGLTGVAYSQTLAATSTTPVTWSIDGGDLPDGLDLAAATGIISGTPTTVGTSTFTVKATNAGGTDTKELSIEVTVPPTYTVTFETGSGGSSVADITGVISGTTISAPTPPTRPFALTEPGLYFGAIPENYTFVEWRNGATAWNFASSTVTGNITLTAHWTASANRIETVAANNIPAAFTRITASGNEGVYTLAINQDIILTAMHRVNNGNRHLTIIGLGSERTITASTEGAFSFGNGNNSLTLENYITISGVENMTDHLVRVNSGSSGLASTAILTMKAGSKITGFNTTNVNYQPVNVTYATFIMDGGEISGNSVITTTGSAASSAGVWLGANSTFTMNGGTITNNTLEDQISSVGSGGGGGVRLGTGGFGAESTVFIMNGGTIFGNTRNGDPMDVHIPNNSIPLFTYNGGTIGALWNKTGSIVSMPATP